MTRIANTVETMPSLDFPSIEESSSPTRRSRNRITSPDMQWTRVVELADRGPWLARLRVLQSLPEDWDSYGAEPPNETATNAAIQALTAFAHLGIEPTEIDASVENGVCIAIRRENKYADIECFNDGAICAVTSIGDGSPTVWDVRSDYPSIELAALRISVYLQK